MKSCTKTIPWRMNVHSHGSLSRQRAEPSVTSVALTADDCDVCLNGCSSSVGCFINI